MAGASIHGSLQGQTKQTQLQHQSRVLGDFCVWELNVKNTDYTGGQAVLKPLQVLSYPGKDSRHSIGRGEGLGKELDLRSIHIPLKHP